MRLQNKHLHNKRFSRPNHAIPSSNYSC